MNMMNAGAESDLVTGRCPGWIFNSTSFTHLEYSPEIPFGRAAVRMKYELVKEDTERYFFYSTLRVNLEWIVVAKSSARKCY